MRKPMRSLLLILSEIQVRSDRREGVEVSVKSTRGGRSQGTVDTMEARNQAWNNMNSLFCFDDLFEGCVWWRRTVALLL